MSNVATEHAGAASPIHEDVLETRSEAGSISKKDLDLSEEAPIDFAPVPGQKQGGLYAANYRPPVDYSSFGAFYTSSFARFKSLWTKRFTLALLVCAQRMLIQSRRNSRLRICIGGATCLFMYYLHERHDYRAC